jgi:hypothetical protein
MSPQLRITAVALERGNRLINDGEVLARAQ